MKRTAAVAAPKAAVAAAAQHKPTKHHNKSLSMKQQAAERRKAAQAQQDEKQQQQQKENDLLDCDVCISSEVQFKPIALDLAKHKRMLSVYEPEEELDRTPLHSHDVVMFDGFHVDWWNCVKHVLFCATQASDNVHALRNLPVPYRTWSVYQLHDGKFRILYLLSTRLDASVMIDQADLMEAIEQVVDIVCEQEQYDEDCILFLKQCEIDLKRRLSRVRGVVVAQR